MKLICIKCKKEFDGRKRRRFCSKSCAIAYRNLGKHHSEITRKKISESHKGKIPWNRGIPRTEECKRKMSLNHSDMSGSKNPNYGNGDKIKGAKNPMWKGGISKEPYPFNFDEELKELIRKRDNYICRECGRTQEQELLEIKRRLAIHHADYDKKNCDPNNLITLCNACNAKANYQREDWIKHFKEKLCLSA